MDLLSQIVEQHLTQPNSKFETKDLAKMVPANTTDLNYPLLQDTVGDISVMNFLPVMMDEYFYYQVNTRGSDTVPAELDTIVSKLVVNKVRLTNIFTF